MEEGKTPPAHSTSPWDCGSPLYDAVELASVYRVRDTHLMALPCSPRGRGAAADDDDAAVAVAVAVAKRASGRSRRRRRAAAKAAAQTGQGAAALHLQVDRLRPEAVISDLWVPQPAAAATACYGIHSWKQMELGDWAS